MASPDTQVNSERQDTSDAVEAALPSVWRTLGRLLHESVYIVFFIGLHWVIKWWLVTTHQDQDWWAKYLVNVSILFAVVAFTVVFGSELIIDCKHVVTIVYKELRKKR